MTARLEAAIRGLEPGELEQVTAIAEAMIRNREAPTEKQLNLSWVGCMANEPDRDGVEAQRRANEIRMELLEKSLRQ